MANKEYLKKKMMEALEKERKDAALFIPLWEKVEWKRKKDGSEFANPKNAVSGCSYEKSSYHHHLSVVAHNPEGYVIGHDYVYLEDGKLSGECVKQRISEHIAVLQGKADKAKEMMSELDSVVDEFYKRVDSLNEWIKDATKCEKDEYGRKINNNYYYMLRDELKSVY